MYEGWRSAKGGRSINCMKKVVLNSKVSKSVEVRVRGGKRREAGRGLNQRALRAES
jgi:hypothetical protein